MCQLAFHDRQNKRTWQHHHATKRSRDIPKWFKNRNRANRPESVWNSSRKEPSSRRRKYAYTTLNHGPWLEVNWYNIGRTWRAWRSFSCLWPSGTTEKWIQEDERIQTTKTGPQNRLGRRWSSIGGFWLGRFSWYTCSIPFNTSLVASPHLWTVPSLQTLICRVTQHQARRTSDEVWCFL